jgi:proteasome lid subunit RPN8/RPN11
MSWNELPPDFKLEEFSRLTGKLGVADAYLLLRLGEREESLVLVDEGAAKRAMAHVSGFDVESGGLLVGKTFTTNATAFACLRHVIAILNCVPADEVTGTSVALRMESKLWTKANESKPDDQFVVGWFHSHPNLGAFFSGTDRGTQARFFSDSHKVGWVIDPIRKEDAWFIGGNSRELPEGCVVKGNLSRLF